MESHHTLHPPTRKAEIVVDRLQSGEILPAATVLARSFVDERFWAHVFEGVPPDDMARAMIPWFRTWLDAFEGGGQIHTARHGGELVGVGIRMAPGDHPLAGLAKLRFLPRLAISVLKMSLTTTRVLRVPAAAQVIESHEPHEPFWNLAWLGVLPERQGIGVGAALADEALRCVEAHPAPAWLITFGPRTRALYARRGFEVTATIRPLPEGPEGWSMRLDPR